MRILLLQLPSTAPGPSAVYGHAWLDTVAGNSRVHRQQTPLALLPRAERQTEVVALVPAQALSWHRVSLPAGLGRTGPRVQAALAGLLEDRLLQDPAQLHLALPARWTAGEPTWVAACDKTWLQAHLQALNDAGLPVQRIVPELAPPEDGQSWQALGQDEATGWLWCCSAEQGVSGWPLALASQLALPGLTDATVQAEPALATWVQSRLHTEPLLNDPASHWRTAALGPWDLAQFDLHTRHRAGHWPRLRRLADTALRQPQWRAARWGLLAVLATQLVGLNVWAWMARQQWQDQQEQWTTILQQTFPKVSVVVDAPLQMAREVARLRQGSGQLTPTDFETQLQALGTALPPGAPGPSSLSYQDGVLQWPEMALSPPQKAAFEQALQRQGYTLQASGSPWRLQAQDATP